MRRRLYLALLTSIAVVIPLSGSARAADRLCDPGAEECRAILINYIRAERVGIDVAFWFMEDARYTTELAIKRREGVPIRVLIDTKANSRYPLNAQRIAELQAAGIPIRRINSSTRYLHWKMMLFDGQNVVQFSGANYSPSAWTPGSATPFADYVDESIYFSDNGAIVNSFRTKFDDAWVSTSGWTNYANITTPLVRSYDIFAKHPDLNFPPSESYRSRAVARYNAETRGIDVIMYRITDRAHADAMIAAVKRGVPVRLITEPDTYRDKDHIWHAWNVDRMYMNGVQIKQRAHAGLNHQKSVLLTNQRMAIFGSSNWTTASDVGRPVRAQHVHHAGGSLCVVRESVRAQVVQHGRHRRERRFRAAGSRHASAARARGPRDGCRHQRHASLVGRLVGARLRRVFRDVARSAADCREPGAGSQREPDGFPDLSPSLDSGAGHDVLLEDRRQDRGERGEVEPRVDVYHRGGARRPGPRSRADSSATATAAAGTGSGASAASPFERRMHDTGSVRRTRRRPLLPGRLAAPRHAHPGRPCAGTRTGAAGFLINGLRDARPVRLAGWRPLLPGQLAAPRHADPGRTCTAGAASPGARATSVDDEPLHDAGSIRRTRWRHVLSGQLAAARDADSWWARTEAGNCPDVRLHDAGSFRGVGRRTLLSRRMVPAGNDASREMSRIQDADAGCDTRLIRALHRTSREHVST
jgi:hypothetical protein